MSGTVLLSYTGQGIGWRLESREGDVYMDY